MALKTRLGIVFTGLILLAILFASSFLVRQYQMSMRGAEDAIRAHEETASAIEMRDALLELDRKGQLGEISEVDRDRFERALRSLQERSRDMESAAVLREVNRRYDLYVQALKSYAEPRGKRQSLTFRNIQDDLAAEVNAFIELNQNWIYRKAERLRNEEAASMRAGLLGLTLFIVLIGIAGTKIISVLTKPLSEFAAILDTLDIEKDLPADMPRLESQVPELGRVAISFRKLWSRLQIYQRINLQRLLLEKRRADIVAASISDGVFLMRGDEILYANPTGERILGLSPGVAIPGLRVSRNATGGRVSGDREVKMSGLQAIAIAISRTMPVEFVLEQDERKSYYLIQAIPIPGDVLEQLDQGDRSRNEASGGDEAADGIERFRPNALILAQDVTLVRESQDAKSHFLGTLSHEIKTPVTSLTMATRLLKRVVDQIPNPTHRSLIETCAEDVDRLRKLLDDLLNISRFDTLTQRLEMQDVDISKLVKHSVQSFQVQAFERGLELVQPQPNPAHNGSRPLIVAMDPTKISWALSNLLINALRHTPRGGRIEVQLATSDEYVEVRVRDTGPGIDRHRQERIFDKFNSFYDLRVARTGSVGAGLAITREIVSAHGGRIWVLSEPGHGAEFCFTLPLKRPTISQQEARSTKGAINGTSARG